MKVANPENSDGIALEIDRLFANSPTETKTTTEKGFMQGFTSQIGNIGKIINYIVLAVFFTMLLVAGNTMAQSVRERTSELAVMKTLGFSDGTILRMVLSESVLLSVVSGGLGLLLAYGIVGGMQAQLSRFLPGLAISQEAMLIGLGLAVGLGVVAGLLPALQASRLNVVEALARR